MKKFLKLLKNIGKKHDYDYNSLFLNNNKKLIPQLTVSEAGLIDGSEILVFPNNLE